MRHLAFAFICSLLSGPALGAAGAALPVIGDRVSVRAGPGTDRGDVMQVSRNQRLVERQGDRVHAGIAGAGGAAGWIHGALPALPDGDALVPSAPQQRPSEEVATASAAQPAAGRSVPARPAEDLSDASAAAPEPRTSAVAETEALAPEVSPVDLERFRDTVAYYNSRSKSVAGVDLFSEVAAIGGGTVQVRASDGWARLPPAAQRNYITALLERWAAATGRADHLRVQIVDPSGQVLMEQSRP